MAFSQQSASWWDAEGLIRRLAADEEEVRRGFEEVRRGFWRKLRQLVSQLPFAEDLVTAHYCAPAHDVAHQCLLGLRLALRPRAPDDTADVAALEQYEIERELRNLSGGEADHEVTALPAEGRPAPRRAQLLSDRADMA